MLKYTQTIANREMLEFTNKRRNKKTKLLKRTNLLRKTSFISRESILGIIHKFNYFDLVLILVLIFIVSFLVFNRLQKVETTLNIRLSVENSDWWYQGSQPRAWYANGLKPGQTAKDAFGNETIEVLSVENYDNGGPYRNIFLNLRIQVQHDKRRNQYLYQHRPIAVGSFLNLSFTDYQVQGIIIKLGDRELEPKYKTIRVKKGYADQDTDPISAPTTLKYRVGDKAYDSSQSLVVEVLDLKTDIASYYTYSDIRGTNVKTFNPDYRNVEMTLKIKTYNWSGIDYYVNNTPIKIGNKIWIQLPSYALENFEIVDILD